MKSTAKFASNVQQVNENSLKHWHYYIQPLAEDFHLGRRMTGRKIRRNNHRKE